MNFKENISMVKSKLILCLKDHLHRNLLLVERESLLFIQRQELALLFNLEVFLRSMFRGLHQEKLKFILSLMPRKFSMDKSIFWKKA
jgi:hypothetical protein